MTTDERRVGPLFWISAAAGWLVIGWGLRGIFQHSLDTRPANLARFVVGGALLHDLIVAPLVLRILTMAVSRKREFLADATGAEFTRNPGALATALDKLERHHSPTQAITKGAAHLCIVDPLGRAFNNAEGKQADLFGSHPPIRTRIKRLEGMAYMYAKREGSTLNASAEQG